MADDYVYTRERFVEEAQLFLSENEGEDSQEMLAARLAVKFEMIYEAGKKLRAGIKVIGRKDGR